MTAAAALLTRLEHTGLSVSVAPDGLHVRPRELLTDELRAAVKDEREALISLLLGAHFRWSVSRPGAWAMEVRFSPDATLDQVRALYPGAVCEPLPDTDAEPQPQPAPEAGDDDRRPCEQCANLDRHRGRDGFRRCAAARRGELPYVPSRDYAPVPDLRKRCEGFLPMAADADRRTGRERWKGLNDTGGE